MKTVKEQLNEILTPDALDECMRSGDLRTNIINLVSNGLEKGKEVEKTVVLLNEKELYNVVNDKGKKIMKTIIDKQKQYGNYDIFSAKIDKVNHTIEIGLGESWGVFRKSNSTHKWERDYGNMYKEEQMKHIVHSLAFTYFHDKDALTKPKTQDEMVR